MNIRGRIKNGDKDGGMGMNMGREGKTYDRVNNQIRINIQGRGWIDSFIE